MTDARKNRETGKGGRADRPCGPPPPPPLFCGRLNNRGNRLSRGRGGGGGVLCFCGDQRGPGNCARDVSFFNSVFQGGEGRGVGMACGVFRGRWENVDGSVADGLEKSWREEDRENYTEIIAFARRVGE